MWKPQEHCEWGAEGWELACKVSRAQQAEQKSLPQRGEEEQRPHPVPWAWGLWLYSCLGGELHQTINREGIESGVSLRKELVCRSAWEEAKSQTGSWETEEGATAGLAVDMETKMSSGVILHVGLFLFRVLFYDDLLWDWSWGWRERTSITQSFHWADWVLLLRWGQKKCSVGY